MRRRSNLLTAFEGRMRLQTPGETIWFRCGFGLLLVYLEFAFFFQNLFLGATSPIYLGLSALAAVPLCAAGVLLARKLRVVCTEPAGKAPRYAALLGSAATLAVMLTAQAAFFPGSFNNDNIVQLQQVHSGVYNNWHPVLHTWLFFTLPLKLVPQYWFIVTAQLVWFSLAVGYLMYVLSDTGCPRWLLVFGWFFTVLNPNTVDTLLYPVKDAAMSIFCLVLFAQLIRIYHSGGAWLKDWKHAAVFSLFAFLALGMRHNAVLLIAPVYVILLCFFRSSRRQTAASAAAVLAAFLFWQNAALPMAGVENPGSRPVELLGAPMTVLCDIYTTEPQALGEDARAFLEDLATEEAWSAYEACNFNSVKWSDPALSDKVNAAGTGTILGYTLDAALAAPKAALRSFAGLTHLVWGFENTRGFAMGEEIGYNTLGIQPAYNDTLKFAFTSWREVCNVSALKYLFMLLGSMVLFLLFLAVGQLGGGKLGRVMLVLAPMAYDFGTMLLLSGPDYRFFHMNYVIALPIAYIILMEKRKTDA